MEKLFEIENGNVLVSLYEDGTRVVETLDPSDDFLDLDLPLSLDINISNKCSNNCEYCYAGNTPFGRMADLLKMDYLNGIEGIEIAINIQYPLPENFEFWLCKMRDQNIIVSGTISQIDLERSRDIVTYLKKLQDERLLNGIGISYRSYNPELEDLLYHNLNNVVFHTIVGVTAPAVITRLLNRGFKVLILGYKQKERGIDYFAKADIGIWYQSIDDILRFKHKAVLSFDTSAINQLKLKDKLTEKEWDRFYQGDEGSISFYIDAVNNTFNIDSHTTIEPIKIGKKKLKVMFKDIKKKVRINEE